MSKLYRLPRASTSRAQLPTADLANDSLSVDLGDVFAAAVGLVEGSDTRRRRAFDKELQTPRADKGKRRQIDPALNRGKRISFYEGSLFVSSYSATSSPHEHCSPSAAV
jgi:hypothetical protein